MHYIFCSLIHAAKREAEAACELRRVLDVAVSVVLNVMGVTPRQSVTALAITTLATPEPTRAASYLRELNRAFIKGPQDLDLRTKELDTRRDPDGRFRVNAFYCHVDTWQITMRRLVTGSNAVLMDLRGFAANNQGCVYELEQLLNTAAVCRVTLIVDDTTDRKLLGEVLKQAWRRIPATSPNVLAADSRLTMFSRSRRENENNEPLLRLLFSAGAVPP